MYYDTVSQFKPRRPSSTWGTFEISTTKKEKKLEKSGNGTF